MTEVETVGGLPALGAGAHAHPEQGACLMEYVSVLAGEPFSDRPHCVDRRLASLARAINDVLGESTRPQLAPLAPALIGTAGPSRSRSWWARAGAWLLAAPGSEMFAEAELRREVARLAYALIAAGQSDTACDQTLIAVLAQAVTEHRRSHRLPPVETAVLPDQRRPGDSSLRAPAAAIVEQ